MDSSNTIYKSTIKALNLYGIQANIPEDEFNYLIGKHFNDIFAHFNVSVDSFTEFIKIYKSVYFDFIDYSSLYPKIIETLKKLKDEEMKISLLTTKAQDQAEKIIEHFELSEYFDLLMGRRDEIEHKPSPQPLLMICNSLKVSAKQTLMIGDTELDIQCGKNAGAKTCAVSYGYRSIEQLDKEKPDYIIKDITGLNSIVIS